MLVHVAILSEQLLANIIPALMERPSKLYLACSAEMAARGFLRRLVQFLRSRKIDVVLAEGAPDAGLQDVHEFALQLLGRVQAEHPGAEIVLNATGGNKLMALGFVEVFRGDAARIVYADTQHRRIEYLPQTGRDVLPARPMVDVLDVESYLAAQGFVLSGAQSDEPGWMAAVAHRKEAAKHLGQRAQALGAFIGALNDCAQKAMAHGDTLVAPRQDLKDVFSRAWKDGLALLARKELIKWAGQRDIEFLDLEGARFCAGGWLEEYAWHVIHDERPCDVKLGVTGSWEHGRKARNEFDVLAVNGNQLLFVECKTLRHGREAASDSDILYKLDSLGRDARGLFGSSWLLAAREPTLDMADRAKAQRIRIIGPGELPRLRDIVREWLQGARPVGVTA